MSEAKLVTLAGNTHPRANILHDRGAVADALSMKHLWLQLKRSPEQQSALDAYTVALSDPRSSGYHKWLSAQQFGERFGVSQEDIETVTGWLHSHGLKVEGVAVNRTLISFSGTAGQVSDAFHTTIHNLSIDNAAYISNMSDPKIPAALAPAITGVVKLNNLKPHPMHTAPRGRRFVQNRLAKPHLTTGDDEFLAPQDLATIYNLNPLFQTGYTGRGQTIAVLEDSDVFTPSDWTQFRKLFGLTRPYIDGSLTEVHPTSEDAPCEDPGVTDHDTEAILDAQWASAAAPNAHIVLAACANTYQYGQFIALFNLLNSDAPPDVVSISYGAAEEELGSVENAFINALYQQAAAEGVSVFVSSGDTGADNNTSDIDNNVARTGISVNGLGSTIYNVSVGGTDYEDTFLGQVDRYWENSNTPFSGSAKSYIPEIPWNQTCASVLIADYLGFGTTYGPSGLCNSTIGSTYGLLGIGAAGGGPSSIYAKPSWQSVFGNPSDEARDLPDVSLFAAAGFWGHSYLICYSGQGQSCADGTIYLFGGTSFSSPILAGIQALVNQRAGGRTGNPNPVYYSLARSEYGAHGNAGCDASLGSGVATGCVFHDITRGDIDIMCRGKINCFTDGAPNGVLSVSSSRYEPAYPAYAGWDFATGLGSVNAYNLVMRWPSPQK